MNIQATIEGKEEESPRIFQTKGLKIHKEIEREMIKKSCVMSEKS